MIADIRLRNPVLGYFTCSVCGWHLRWGIKIYGSIPASYKTGCLIGLFESKL